MVLRHARRPLRFARLHQSAPSDLRHRGGVRRDHPPDPGVDRAAAPTLIASRRPRDTSGGGRRHLGPPPAAGTAAVQPGRVQLCRAGRDGQPPHRPVCLRNRRARVDAVQHHARLNLDEHPVALRPDVPVDRWAAERRIRPSDPARRCVAAAPGGGRPRTCGGGHSFPGPPAGPGSRRRRSARRGIAPGPGHAHRGGAQRSTHARPPPRWSGGSPTMGHDSRHHPLRGRGRGEVAGRAGCPFPRVGLGRSRARRWGGEWSTLSAQAWSL